MSNVKATVLESTSDLPEGHLTRQDILTKLHLDVPQNSFSYAARMGKLGPYYAVGRLGYYSLAKATEVWGRPGQKASATKKAADKKTSKKAGKKAAKKVGKVAAKTNEPKPVPATGGVRIGELPEVTGRTSAEIAALVGADEFVPAGCTLMDGEPLWPIETVRGWAEKNPPPATTLVFHEGLMTLDRALPAGTYKLVLDNPAKNLYRLERT